MINHIHIRNLALIPEIELDLHQGLSVFTGETGAGKSLFTDALGLALGHRADSGMIREGCKKAEVNISLTLNGLTPVQTWLHQHELSHDDDPNECRLRRTLTNDGRSRAYINGSPVSLQQLRHLGAQLVNLQGQQTQLGITKPSQQRHLLDQFANYPALLSQVEQHYQQWAQADERLKQLKSEQTLKGERLQLLRFQREELQALALQKNELCALETQHRYLANASELQDMLKTTVEQLESAETGSAVQALNQSIAALQYAQTIDPCLQEASQMLAEALILTSEACRSCQASLEAMPNDPEALQRINDRLGLIYDTARKYRVTPQELPELIERTHEEYQTLTHIDSDIEQHRQHTHARQQQFSNVAQQLTQQRQQAAMRLSAALTQRLQALGMASAQLDIRLLTTTDTPKPHGQDTVQWLFTANTGISPQPISDIASGGELSRIGLAIHSVIARDTQTPTLIFDEADTGVGGKVAEFIGKLLQELARTHQVLCITHLPQVARYGTQHIRISKQSTENNTQTLLTPLRSKQARIEELARMLGGVEITHKTREHAQEMLESIFN